MVIAVVISTGKMPASGLVFWLNELKTASSTLAAGKNILHTNIKEIKSIYYISLKWRFNEL